MSDWKDFISQNWEKQPRVLGSSDGVMLPKIDASELFGAVTACCADYLSARRDNVRVRFYVAAQQVDLLQGAHDDLLPSDADRSFEGYNHRVSTKYHIDDYALIVSDWHQFAPDLWERVILAVHGLAECVGVTNAMMDTHVFAGTYRQTPFGVHADRAGVFHLPIIGTKTMRFWDNAFAVKHAFKQQMRTYADFLESSVVHSASPGEIMYWPSHYWHVGESAGEFGVVWGFGYWFGDQTRQAALRRIGLKLDRAAATATQKPRELHSITAGSDAVRAVIDEVRSLFSAPELYESMLRNWLERYSAYGFDEVPDLKRGRLLGNGGALMMKEGFYVLSAVIGQDVLVAAAGHSRRFQNQLSLGLLNDLNERKPITYGEITSRHDRELLDFLAEAGVLGPCPT